VAGKTQCLIKPRNCIREPALPMLDHAAVPERLTCEIETIHGARLVHERPKKFERSLHFAEGVEEARTSDPELDCCLTFFVDERERPRVVTVGLSQALMGFSLLAGARERADRPVDRRVDRCASDRTVQ